MPSLVYNRPELKAFRKTLRSNGTTAEAALWKLLKGKQVQGRKFRRQHSVGPYVLDFYCADENLAVELDGAAHFTPEGQAHDRTRTEYLNSEGIRVVRFENYQVLEYYEEVIAGIKACFRKE
jgi:very-short-patch-repair endonuclease